jgi:tetratricopeptide (TPR) repeat protein
LDLWIVCHLRFSTGDFKFRLNAVPAHTGDFLAAKALARIRRPSAAGSLDFVPGGLLWPAILLLKANALASGLLAAALLFFAASAACAPLQQAGTTAAAQARQQFDEARKLLRQGQVEPAQAAVEQGLKLSPRSIDGLNLAGLIYSQARNYDRAIASFRRALELDPRSLESHMGLGNIYFAEKRVDLAEQEFRQALAIQPRDRGVNYNLGLVLLAEKKPQAAITYFQRVQPPDSPTLLNLVQAYFATGQKAKAIEIARSLSSKDRNDLQLHFTLGVVLASQKQYSMAVQEFELADALKPGTFEILHNLGEAELRAGNRERAEGVLTRALELQPDSANTLFLLGKTYADEGKDVQALEVLTRAHQLAPQNTDVIFLLSRLSMKQSYFEDAIQLLEQGVRIAPRRADLHAALGESYFMAGNVTKALQEFTELIRLDPSASSYAFMGLCYRHLGRFDEARKYLNEGLRRDPHNAACLYSLGFIESKQGNYAAAEKLLERAIAAQPDYSDALFELAGVKMAQRRYAEAIPLLRRALKDTDKPAEVYYKLATAERNLHQTEAAARDLKIFETLSKDPRPGPYPLQHLFDYFGQRAALPPRQKADLDLQELRAQVEKRPDQPRNLYLLAEAYLKLGRLEEARETIKKLDQVSGQDARTSLGTGVLLARYHLYPEAIEHFQAALTADPASDDARYNLANTYFQRRDYRRALEALEQISPAGRNDSAVMALYGDVCAHLDRTREASEAFERAIAANPDNDQNYLSLALVRLRSGDVRSAEKVLRSGLARVPDSARLLWGMGVVAALEGRNAEAEADFQRAQELMPDWQSSYSALGVFYYETGQIAAARATLERYRKLFPHGTLDVSRIEQTLEASAALPQRTPAPLGPEARQRFLQFATALADQP